MRGREGGKQRGDWKRQGKVEGEWKRRTGKVDWESGRGGRHRE